MRFGSKNWGGLIFQKNLIVNSFGLCIFLRAFLSSQSCPRMQLSGVIGGDSRLTCPLVVKRRSPPVLDSSYVGIAIGGMPLAGLQAPLISHSGGPTPPVSQQATCEPVPASPLADEPVPGVTESVEGTEVVEKVEVGPP